MCNSKFIFIAVIVLSHAAAVLGNTKLLTGGTIVAYDEATQLPIVIRGGALIIKDDRIDQILDQAPPSNYSLSTNTEVIDCTNKIITPGFVDTHRHGWQTVYKTMASNTTLADYTVRYSAIVAQPLFTPDDVYISQKVGIYEALNAGSTTILDHAHHTWTAEHAAAGFNGSIDSGGRVFWAYAFQNVSTSNFTQQEQLQQWRELNTRNSTNLTTLAMAYDEFTANPFGKNTQDIVSLAK